MTTAEQGHHRLVGQPHDDSEGPVADAEAEAAKLRSEEQPLGRPGPPVDRRSPFFVGMVGAAGVAVTYFLTQFVVAARDVLVLIGLALFLAVGLEPAVSWLVRQKLPRWAAVTVVLVGTLALVGGFVAVAITPLVDQGTQFVQRLPDHLRLLQDHNSLLGRLNDRFHLQQLIQNGLSAGQSNVVGGLLGAGRVVLNAVTSTVAVIVLTVYFLGDLPRIRRTVYRLVPRSRRPRAILIGDEIVGKIGAYVLGNLLVSIITGTATFVWLLVFGVPYAILLGIAVAILDLIPVVGSTIGGIVVTLVAATVSWPIAIATAAFYVAWRFLEDYLLVPKIIGRVVDVPAVVTVVAILVGAALLGVLGAFVAIPVAAAVLLVTREVLLPRLDRA
jgi:predicted PurR-regulated permease PerM